MFGKRLTFVLEDRPPAWFQEMESAEREEFTDFLSTMRRKSRSWRLYAGLMALIWTPIVFAAGGNFLTWLSVAVPIALVEMVFTWRAFSGLLRIPVCFVLMVLTHWIVFVVLAGEGFVFYVGKDVSASFVPLMISCVVFLYQWGYEAKYVYYNMPEELRKYFPALGEE